MATSKIKMNGVTQEVIEAGYVTIPEDCKVFMIEGIWSTLASNYLYYGTFANKRPSSYYDEWGIDGKAYMIYYENGAFYPKLNSGGSQISPSKIRLTCVY